MATDSGIGLHYAVPHLVIALDRFHASLDHITLSEIVQYWGCQSEGTATEVSHFVHLACELFALVVSITEPRLGFVPMLS